MVGGFEGYILFLGVGIRVGRVVRLLGLTLSLSFVFLFMSYDFEVVVFLNCDCDM